MYIYILFQEVNRVTLGSPQEVIPQKATPQKVMPKEVTLQEVTREPRQGIMNQDSMGTHTQQQGASNMATNRGSP